MHKLPQPVKALVLGPVLPPRGAAGRAASASSPRSAPRRSAPTIPSLDAEMILLLRELLREAGRQRAAAAARRASARRDPRAPTPTSCATTCARARTSCPTRCAPGIDANPLRAFDSDHEGTRAVMEDAPRLLDRLDARGRRALRRGARAARRRRRRLRARRRRWCAGSTTTRARCSSSRATRSARRAGVGGGGRYDGLVEQLGGPPTPGVGWAAGIERILLAARDARPASGAAECLRGRGRAGGDAARRSRSSRELREARRARRDGAGRAARSRASSSTPTASARALTVIVGGRELEREGHGQRRAGRVAATSSTKRVQAVSREAAASPTATATTGPASCASSDVGQRAARRRLGAPPPRPRRPDLHRPARPHRPAAARLPPRRRAPRPTPRPTGCAPRT